ncbi:MAG: hypothetical protein AAF403_06815, partial [Pseudomonadota bacterium]
VHIPIGSLPENQIVPLLKKRLQDYLMTLPHGLVSKIAKLLFIKGERTYHSLDQCALIIANLCNNSGYTPTFKSIYLQLVKNNIITDNTIS